MELKNASNACKRAQSFARIDRKTITKYAVETMGMERKVQTIRVNFEFSMPFRIVHTIKLITNASWRTLCLLTECMQVRFHSMNFEYFTKCT